MRDCAPSVALFTRTPRETGVVTPRAAQLPRAGIVVNRKAARISMDGKGRALATIFTECLWRAST